MEDYSKNKIKEYQYWEVYIHENQSYLGRCYVWAKRGDALDLPHANEEEQKELFIILKDIEKALIEAFGADMLNYSFLGNITHHLHGHIIPRYAKEVVFEGITFTDKSWGNNYKTDIEFKIPEEVFEKIKNKITEYL